MDETPTEALASTLPVISLVPKDKAPLAKRDVLPGGVLVEFVPVPLEEVLTKVAQAEREIRPTFDRSVDATVRDAYNARGDRGLIGLKYSNPKKPNGGAPEGICQACGKARTVAVHGSADTLDACFRKIEDAKSKFDDEMDAIQQSEDVVKLQVRAEVTGMARRRTLDGYDVFQIIDLIKQQQAQIGAAKLAVEAAKLADDEAKATLRTHGPSRNLKPRFLKAEPRMVLDPSLSIVEPSRFGMRPKADYICVAKTEDVEHNATRGRLLDAVSAPEEQLSKARGALETLEHTLAYLEDSLTDKLSEWRHRNAQLGSGLPSRVCIVCTLPIHPDTLDEIEMISQPQAHPDCQKDVPKLQGHMLGRPCAWCGWHFLSTTHPDLAFCTRLCAALGADPRDTRGIPAPEEWDTVKVVHMPRLPVTPGERKRLGDVLARQMERPTQGWLARRPEAIEDGTSEKSSRDVTRDGLPKSLPMTDAERARRYRERKRGESPRDDH